MTKHPDPVLRWTAEQAAAIQSNGHTLLEASAGTGKTTTIVGKILWLLGLEHGVNEITGKSLTPCPEPCALHEIAAITFTEKAAYDIKRQLRRAIEASKQADDLRWQLEWASLGTIHSFCGSLLREHALRLDIDPAFRILDENTAWAAQDDLIRTLLFERLETDDQAVQLLLQRMSLTGKKFKNGAVDWVRAVMKDLRWRQELYDRWTRDGHLDIPTLAELAKVWDERDAASVAVLDALVDLATIARERWLAWLQEENARDFDSLILDARELLCGRTSEAALSAIRRRYRVLIIDEFQDTDFVQRDIALAIGASLTTSNSTNPRPQLFLVGDPKQSIYRFRGADASVWNTVVETLGSGASQMSLSHNFRCQPSVVEFVNAAAGFAIENTAAALAEESARGRISHTKLVPTRPSTEQASLEWLVPAGDTSATKNSSAGDLVVQRISGMVSSGERIVDVGSGAPRPCRYGDIALLYRNRAGLEHFESALSREGVPYGLVGASDLSERQEVLDVVNALRLIRNPANDLRAVGFLRSPFVCLRDEVIARLRFEAPGAPLLHAARLSLEAKGFEAPEHAAVLGIEHEALSRGLDTIEVLYELAPRVPLDELVSELLERTGYRLHLQLGNQPEESLANLDSFVHFCEGYRDSDIDRLLEIWDRRPSRELGIPQTPLYSQEDNVVTLSTIHAAKGLEWPIIFLLGVDKQIWPGQSMKFWSDRDLGPVLCSTKAERGPRTQRLAERNRLESNAEEARLLYVATTRARDRLLVVGARNQKGAYAEWLGKGVKQTAVTFRQAVRGSDGSMEVGPVEEGRSLQVAGAATMLRCLDRLHVREPPKLVRALGQPCLRPVVSATESMLRIKDHETWKQRFVHGVQPSWEFSGGGRAPALPPTVRGTLIHGVLERVRGAAELSAILEETISEMGDPGLGQLLSVGTDLRSTLEHEIRSVVESVEWAWYVDEEHHRELQFVHLFGVQDWRIGAFDLYRPGTACRSSPSGADENAWVIDFKTHTIRAEEVRRVADEYRIQVEFYRQAAGIRSPACVRLHFTGANVTVDSEPQEPAVQRRLFT